jgi:hypothetical protein
MTWLKPLFNLKLTIILFSCTFSSLISAQTPSERISEIKGMYNEIMGLGELNCIENSMIDYIDVGGEMYEMEQQAASCFVNYKYGINKGIINDWEYTGEIYAYYFQGNLFFVYMKYYDVTFEGELRFYFYENGDIVQILQKNNENGEDLSLVPNTKVEDEELKNSLITNLYSDLEKIQVILNQD